MKFLSILAAGALILPAAAVAQTAPDDQSMSAPKKAKKSDMADPSAMTPSTDSPMTPAPTDPAMSDPATTPTPSTDTTPMEPAPTTPPQR